jgi:hypothetical protein
LAANACLGDAMKPEPTWLIVLVCSVLACVMVGSLACHTGLIACS